MTDVKLRDQRKPGYCWQDNELYDAFRPVIGPNAVNVYTHMTRNCYGTEIRSSSRDLARESGLGKDTVLRSIRVMERIGMLRAVEGGPRGPRILAEYDLVDLKELAQHHGGTFDRRRTSYVFSAELTARLKAIAAGDSAASSGAVGDSRDAGVKNLPGARMTSASGAVGDRPGPVFAPDLALGKPTSGAGDGFVSLSASQESKTQDNPPTPREAGDASGSSDGETQARIAELRTKRAAERMGSDEWFRLSCELKTLLDRAAPQPVLVATGADPPLTPGRRRRRLTQAMLAARVGS